MVIADFSILPLIGMAVTLFGVWYKINSDINDKIGSAKKEATEQYNKLSTEVNHMRATAISRSEHERDIDRVKEEIRSFRDEVREDIRAMSTTLTDRLDRMMQSMSKGTLK